MKFCASCWEKLRDAVRARGLYGFVAQGGENVVRRMAAELEDGPSAVTFEPLMGAHNAIVANALGVVGIALLAPNEDGSEKCPICFLQSVHDAHCTMPAGTCTPYASWIGRAVDDQAAEAKRLGLVGAS